MFWRPVWDMPFVGHLFSNNVPISSLTFGEEFISAHLKLSAIASLFPLPASPYPFSSASSRIWASLRWLPSSPPDLSYRECSTYGLTPYSLGHLNLLVDNERSSLGLTFAFAHEVPPDLVELGKSNFAVCLGKDQAFRRGHCRLFKNLKQRWACYVWSSFVSRFRLGERLANFINCSPDQ